MLIRQILIVILLSASCVVAQNAADWQTPAEKTDYRTTPRYTETAEYLKKLDAASPWIRLTNFGKTGEGRDLLLIIAAKNNAVTPEAARRQRKPVILIQACIHAGESDGKDAGLALLRDIAINKKHENLLDNVVLLFEPIYNADGHERFSAFNRINQNGPTQMGFRANARNINLNRDYMKADEPETRAWLKLWQFWKPDLLLDSHVTDGADYRYNITFQYEKNQTVAPAIRAWLADTFAQKIIPDIEAAGNLLAPYLSFEDNRDLQCGVYEFLTTPRYATGYPVLWNRPAVLIESHSLKPHKNRVLGTYDFFRFTLAEINKNPAGLIAANARADAEMLAKFRVYDANAKFPLRLNLSKKSELFTLKGVESRVEQSEISGAKRVIFDSSKPFDVQVPLFRETEITDSVAPPLAYVLPPQWTNAVEILELHNVKFERLKRAQTFEIESYRLKNPKWAGNSFESRVVLREFQSEKTTETREFPANSVLINLQQPAAQIVVHLLEPAAPDSLVRWGFFNSIFEQKEYAESYVLEKIAREMLAKDANLRREFEEKLKDKTFAENPFARLNFFFERSPFVDQNIGLYPVGRIIK